MKKFLSVCLFLVSMYISFAQKSEFNIVSYSIPAGYESIRNNQVLTYYREDKSTGTYCNIFIYALMNGKGGIQKDFDFAWDNLVQKPFKFTGKANLQPVATLKGWQLLMGSVKYSDNGTPTLAMLFTFSDANTTQSICILSNSDQYKKDIEDFIASADVIREAGGINATTPAVKPSAGAATTVQQQKTANTINNKSPRPEVWMKSRFEYDMYKRLSETKYE